MKEIKNFPGYFITEDGKIFSALKRYGRKTIIDIDDLKELKKRIGSRGYLRIGLNKNGKKISRDIHRLVAETYIENPNNLPQVNHIDENKLNNQISNLEWTTNKQNSVHSKCRCIYQIENIITGEITTTINVREFARNNNLNDRHLHSTLNGKRKQHKNYRIISKNQFK